MNVLVDDAQATASIVHAIRVGTGLAGLALIIGALAGCTAEATATTTGAEHTPKALSESPSPSVQCDPSLREPRDRGPREFATGTPLLTENGRLVAYTVAPGDAEIAIADRFCLSQEALDTIFNARRHCLGAELMPGDVFNLDLASVDTVGSRGGRVCHNVVY
ncbi:hypothetical protein [Microbacterium mangrovi]|uniref:hypothetical protein n=1 Tax=Microbacterium mangrovi TaxID=1348253 RepID=UPI0012E05818|nr:hypothetical protein [Microbacterium mangrovi]